MIVVITHSEMTSGGKLLGIDPVLAHKALSLLHVHDAGQRACLLLLPCTSINKHNRQKNTVRLKAIITTKYRLECYWSPIQSRRLLCCEPRSHNGKKWTNGITNDNELLLIFRQIGVICTCR